MDRKEYIDHRGTASEETPEQFAKKRKEYLALMRLDREPDAFVVIDAGIEEKVKKDGTTRTWEPTSYSAETANFPLDTAYKNPYGARESERKTVVVGCGGGKARAIAGAELEKYFPSAKLVTTSVYPVTGDPSHQPPDEHYKVYEDYLENQLHISKENVIAEKESTTTLEGLINLVLLAQKNHWHTLVVITNHFTLPRTETLFRYLSTQELLSKKLAYLVPKLKEKYRTILGVKAEPSAKETLPTILFSNDEFFEALQDLTITFVPAEAVLARRNPKYKRLLRQVLQSRGYKERQKMEERGLSDLMKGEYGK